LAHACGSRTDEEKLQRVKEAIDRFRDMKGALIPVLHEVQDTYGYLPEDVLHLVSDELGIPMTDIYGVTSFYSFFSLEPKGEHIIRVCMGTACYIKGAQSLIDRIGTDFGIKPGETTKDGKFTLEATRCLGACGLAPVMTIDDDVHGRLMQGDIPKVLKKYSEPAKEDERA
jgi:NADH-quinone oxidoreductase subunit E/NADP-reducing hydrogenase subunit HndA